MAHRRAFLTASALFATKSPAKRSQCRLLRSFASISIHSQATYRPSTVLDEWVQREARPISLRQLTFFGRTLTESRLLESANYVRTELPTRIAHRLRDMQTLPYVVVTNPHISHVYDLYFKAFETFRRVPTVKSLKENEQYCELVQAKLREHATIIPRLAAGVLEVQDHMEPEATDKFTTTLLRSRISRRVIAEQHLALTETYHSPWHSPSPDKEESNSEFIGEIFLRCNAKEIVQKCAQTTQDLLLKAHGDSVRIPEVTIEGDLDATFPYIQSHLEYIVGELLRNSIQAVLEQRKYRQVDPPPIQVLICETRQHVIIRISDRGGGVPREILPYLWSFSKGPGKQKRLDNLNKVPHMIGTLQELQVPETKPHDDQKIPDSLGSLSGRLPQLRLGIGLPMSRIYAEYWAGSLALHSLEGYGVDCFLQIPKLGNKNETLTTRASMDAV